MKKILVALTCFALSSPVAVFAQDFSSEFEAAQGEVGFTGTNLAEMIGGLISVALSILGIILLLLMIYAGFLWMTAGGESDKTQKAKDIMINAVIGLIILLAAYAISNFVIDQIQSAI